MSTWFPFPDGIVVAFFPLSIFFCFFFGVCVGRFGFPMASLSSSSFLPVGTASENSHYSSCVFFGEKLLVHSATFVKDSSTKELREEQEKVVFERWMNNSRLLCLAGGRAGLLADRCVTQLDLVHRVCMYSIRSSGTWTGATRKLLLYHA